MIFVRSRAYARCQLRLKTYVHSPHRIVLLAPVAVPFFGTGQDVMLIGLDSRYPRSFDRFAGQLANIVKSGGSHAQSQPVQGWDVSHIDGISSDQDTYDVV